MRVNVLGIASPLGVCLPICLLGSLLQLPGSTAAPAGAAAEVGSPERGPDVTTALSVRSTNTALEPRRDGPYIKYGSGNAAILISWVGATSYGVKTLCSAPAVTVAPQVCVASLVGALVLDFLAAFLLEGRDAAGRHVHNPHGLTLDMTHGEMRSKMQANLQIESFPEKQPHYIGGWSDPETGHELRVYYIEHGNGVVGHRAVLMEPSTDGDNSKRAEERKNGATMDYGWMYNNQKRFNHTDKNRGDVQDAAKSAAYDWYYNHGADNRMCGGPVTDSGRLLDDVGIWYAGRNGGSYPFQPGEEQSEIGSCAADLNAAGYSTN